MTFIGIMKRTTLNFKLQQMSANNPVGTLAFILDEEALLVRVNKGWQYVLVGFIDILFYRKNCFH